MGKSKEKRTENSTSTRVNGFVNGVGDLYREAREGGLGFCSSLSQGLFRKHEKYWQIVPDAP